MMDVSSGGSGGSLPIWGSSPFQNGGADNGMMTQVGGIPSQQGGIKIWVTNQPTHPINKFDFESFRNNGF